MVPKCPVCGGDMAMHLPCDQYFVEDEKNMQDILCDYMHRGGHICFTADDGVDALMIT